MAGGHNTYLPTACVGNSTYMVDHALSCSRGGFPTIQHEIRDITANLLSDVCHSLVTEPCLQPVTREELRYRTTIREYGARLDIVVESFLGRNKQHAFFDGWVFNPFTQSCCTPSPLAQCCCRNEQDK